VHPEAFFMIESIMFFGIGFLVATLFALLLLPLVHNRAARLTMRRLEASTPLSMTEIQADKDQLRAEFAMSTRRLEMSVEQLKAKTTSQLGELGKKAAAINKLKQELGEKSATILSLEAQEKALREQLRTTEQEYSVKSNTMHNVERSLSDREAELNRLTVALGDCTMVSDGQRVEIAALKAQVEALKTQVGQLAREVKEAEDRQRQARSDYAAASKELADERGKVTSLGTRLSQLERQLVAQTTEAEILSSRVEDLEGKLTEQGRLLVEREYEARKLRNELKSVRKVEADLRAELTASEAGHAEATGLLRAEKAQVEQELEQNRAECAKLQHEIAVMKHELETTWASERVENALLRERINDVAAEVASLTLALEGPDSPIEAMLAEQRAGARAPVAGANGPDGTNGARSELHGNLADRIRALQSRASRVAPVG
jgi:chromosome segregation ATPase